MDGFPPFHTEKADPERIARERFGINALYPYQRLVIANILDADAADPDEDAFRRQLVLLPTGAGKSACFQVPSLLLSGPTLVVYPLLSLMADQERRLASAGVPVACLRGGLGREERRSMIDGAASGDIRILLTNPEMLTSVSVAEELRGAGFRQLVIDEAHCVCEWGETFRPAYLSLGDFIRRSGIPIVTAFTATASPPILAGVQSRLFGDQPAHLVAGDPDRPNIRYEVRGCLSRMRETERLCRESEAPRIVFVRSRARAETLAADLGRRLGGIPVWFYHAGLSREEKTRLEGIFRTSDDGVLVATCAYGMGVDKANVRTVIHFEAPPSIEAYLQESGRAGRDGKASRAILLAPCARQAIKRPARAKEPPRRDIEGYGALEAGCRREYLLGYLGWEAPACSGCDLCEGRDRESGREARAVEEYLHRMSGRLSLRQAVLALASSGAFRGSGWRTQDAEEAIAALSRSGSVFIPESGPWKGRIRRSSPRARRLLRFLGKPAASGKRRLGKALLLALGRLDRGAASFGAAASLFTSLFALIEKWPFEAPLAPSGEEEASDCQKNRQQRRN